MLTTWITKMANSPVDFNKSLMEEDFGTKVLITDRASDKYLKDRNKKDTEQEKFTKFCGGSGGWSDYTEWF